MTKKDYQAIARAVNDMPKTNDGLIDQWDVISYLSDMLAMDNDRFDNTRFEEACLTGKCKGMKRGGE